MTPKTTIQKQKENKQSPGQGRKERKYNKRTLTKYQKPNYISVKRTKSQRHKQSPGLGKTAKTEQKQKTQADLWPGENPTENKN